jgi:hypothetical protein
MNLLIDKIDNTIQRNKLQWKRNGRSVTVQICDDGRKQRVRFKKYKDMYTFYSIIHKGRLIKGKKLRREIAYLAWRKNDMKDLVTFAFDDKNNLVGVIEQPVITIDHEELKLYIETLARECDRFEYILTGDDVE